MHPYRFFLEYSGRLASCAVWHPRPHLSHRTYIHRTRFIDNQPQTYSIHMSTPDDALLPQLAGIVSKHLQMSDDEYTLSKFVLSLYKSTEDLVGLRHASFIKAVEDNGGEDFPKQFLDDMFDTLNAGRSLGLSVKSEAGVSIKTEVKTEDQDSVAQKDTSHGTPAPSTSTDKKVKLELTDGMSNQQDQLTALSLPNQAVKLEVSSHGRPSPKHTNNTRKRVEYKVGEVRKGYVSNITAYGAFIRLDSPTSFASGLCHVSKMLFDGRTRIRHPQDVVKPNQEVFVKILLIESANRRDKISLLMIGIDQLTGMDRLEELQEQRGRERKPESAPKRRRLTSPERWEIRQLIASGAASAADYPELNQNLDDEPASVADEDIQFDVELNTEEPKFLKGQSVNSTNSNPLLIIKNPAGSMNRAALSGSKLVQQAREERAEIQRKADRDAAAQRDSSDPLARMRQKDSSHRAQTDSVISEWRKSQLSRKIEYGKHTNMSIDQQRKSLPIFGIRSDLVQAIRDNQFLVIVGETGSGKTTQLVQYIYEEGLNIVDGQKKIIGCTQPRRVAAASVAKRVSEEVGCKLGEEVGYYVRFEDITSAKTKIKYMTDGMLQREALLDPTMLKYSVIMLDEAHERTIATDVLFALLKSACKLNPNLKVIVTSATLDAQKFSRYFNDCPVIRIPGRTFPVEVLYSRESEPDYLAAALDCIMQIHISEPNGDILVFMTGQEEIDTSCEILYQRVKTLGNSVPELIILPVYSALPSEMQSRIFEPAPNGSRKVVLATNIAETSITIDGIKYVVDPGFVKINAYDAKLGMDLLVVSPISQAQANQRSGRAGRTGPGKCFRLYTEAAYNTEMLPNSIPEIQRQNLCLTILMLKAMGINDLLNFEFMDPPPAQTMVNALHELYTLDALDDDGYLTPVGRRMAEFPMEPALAKTVLASAELECTEEILSVVAMLSVQTVFYRPREKQAAADQRKQRFHSIHGDHLTLLNVYKAWVLSGRSATWCKENYIHQRSMQKALDVRRQLAMIMTRLKLPIESCDDLSVVRRAFCSGFFRNLAKRDPHEGIYNTLVDQTPVNLHPLLALFGKSTEYLIYHTLLLTTKEYMHCVSAIDPKWLTELAPKFFRKSDPNNLSERKKKEKIVPLFDRFADSQDAWRLTAHVEAKKKALSQLHQ